MLQNKHMQYFTKEELIKIYKNGSFNIENFLKICENYELKMKLREDLSEENEEEFNEMGLMQAIDNITALLAVMKKTAEDGYTFNNLEDKKIIIKPIMDEKLGHRTHTRDPKVWKYKDRYTLILGSKFIESGSDKFTGEVLFYTSEDGENWSYKNRYYDKKIGDMWECPDLFEVDNEYILIMLRNI